MVRAGVEPTEPNEVIEVGVEGPWTLYGLLPGARRLVRELTDSMEGARRRDGVLPVSSSLGRMRGKGRGTRDIIQRNTV